MRIWSATSLFLIPVLLLSGGCTHRSEHSGVSWSRPWPQPEFENRIQFDEAGNSVVEEVTVDRESAEAADCEYLIWLLEKNNRLLERIADD
jgi:hypothetical protein